MVGELRGENLDITVIILAVNVTNFVVSRKLRYYYGETNNKAKKVR